MDKQTLVIALIIVPAIVAVFFVFIKKQSPVYDPTDAVIVTYDSLPQNIKTSINKEDVSYILELEFQYQQKIGLTEKSVSQPEPIHVGLDQNKFIIDEAAKQRKIYSNEVVDQVLTAEETYLKKIGAIKG